MNDLQNNNQISQETLEKYMELQKMFEKIDFNIELLSRLWAEDRENEMNRERLVEILGLIE